MLLLPQLHATRPFLFPCAETDLSVCERGQTACPEERYPLNSRETGRAQLRWGELKTPIPPTSHPPLSIHRTRDHFWGTKISVMPLCLSTLHHLCCYYLLNSKALTSHSGTLGGGKIWTTVLSGVAISTSIKNP